MRICHRMNQGTDLAGSSIAAHALRDRLRGEPDADDLDAEFDT